MLLHILIYLDTLCIPFRCLFSFFYEDIFYEDTFKTFKTAYFAHCFYGFILKTFMSFDRYY